MNATITTTKFDYDAYDIIEDDKRRLEDSASHIYQLGRKSTEQAFQLGEHLEHASELLPEGSFGKWVGKRCGMTERHARNFRAIHRVLAPYRPRLVDLGVNSTVLVRLTAATGDQIEAAIDLCRENGSIKVKDVQAILAMETDDKPTPTIDPADVGGVDGLKALIVAKVREGLRLFLMHVAEIQAKITAALSGKRVVKSKLADEVVVVTRLAKAELKSLALFVQPRGFDPSVVWDTTFANGSHWARVFSVLQDLGGIDSWPEATKVRSWLEVDVLPALDWATAKTKMPVWLDSAAITPSDVSGVTVVPEDGKIATQVPESKRRQTELALNSAFNSGHRAVARSPAVADVKTKAWPSLVSAHADDDETLGAFFSKEDLGSDIETRDFPQLTASDILPAHSL
jgi:hypothetical protein